MAEPTPGTAPVTDHRISPRGVLPRNAQTFLMLAVAVGILGIIVLTGNRAPQPRPVAAGSTPTDLGLNPERLRDYQDRLRVLDERARQAVSDARPETPPRIDYEPPAAAATPDPLVAERKRREYESLFSSNVVLSRRPEGQRLSADNAGTRVPQSIAADEGVPTPPTIDQVAEAVVRASSRYAQAAPATPDGSSGAEIADRVAERGNAPSSVQQPANVRPIATGPISSNGPLHPVLEGTVIDTVLTNRLDGSGAAPVNCLVTNPVYSHDGRVVLIPAGSRVLGDTKPVTGFGDARLAVSFSRLVLPDGSTYRLDQFTGLNDIGDAGLRDQVNQHYRSTFGASAAVGLITGLAQFLGTAGFNRGDNNRTVIIAGGLGDATSQATAQTLNRFLNRAPSVTIREGHRVKVYVTSDLQLPAYGLRPPAGRPLLTANR